MTDCAAVVVGAGAAGIGAGLALQARGLSFTILEAKDRIGGRAYSESSSLGHPWDQGCHWFHSASINPLRAMALKAGWPFVDEPKSYGSRFWRGGRWGDLAPGDEAFGAMMDRANAAQGGDQAIAKVMNHASPWNSYVRNGLTLTYSHEPEKISIADALAYRDTSENIPVAGGYGAFVASLAAGLPVRTGVAVKHVDVLRDNVRLHTSHGAVTCEQVILAVPARMIEQGRITFTPHLPAEVTESFSKVTMGWFEKIGFAFDRDVFGDVSGERTEIFHGDDPIAFDLGSFNRPLAIAHIAGLRIRTTTAEERIALCEDALVAVFGHDIRKHITHRATTRWTADEFIGGAYSCALPGAAHLRQRFRVPVHDRIHFGGEHTSLDAMATAHGAFVSGQDAVARAFGATAA